MSDDMKEIIIDRATWGRFGVPEESRLLRYDGQMCCLGFICEQHGVPREQLLDVPYPRHLPARERDKVPAWLRQTHIDMPDDTAPDVFVMTQLNDAIEANNKNYVNNDAEREARLTEIAARHNLKLTFIN